MRAPGTLATRAEPVSQRDREPVSQRDREPVSQRDREPVAFRERRAASRALFVSTDFESAALALGLLEPGGLERALAQPAGPSGRARTAVVSLPGRSERLHLRPVLHGGWLGPLLRDRLLGLARPLAELRVNARLRALGVPVPIPVLVAARRVSGFQRAALATVYEEGALDGFALLASPLAAAARQRAASAAGRAVRALHDAGARHADLQLGNLLFRARGAGFDAWVIDLDRARMQAPPGARARMRELMRLHRSLVKWGLEPRLGLRARASFFAAYTQGDRALRRALLRQLPRERARLALHALAWRLARRPRSS
jgi:tRNA A-37 threonylcarbamoyl transferase component Bud32